MTLEEKLKEIEDDPRGDYAAAKVIKALRVAILQRDAVISTGENRDFQNAEILAALEGE